MGGSQAPASVEERVPLLINRIAALTKAESGKLLDHEMELTPWKGLSGGLIVSKRIV